MNIEAIRAELEAVRHELANYGPCTARNGYERYDDGLSSLKARHAALLGMLNPVPAKPYTPEPVPAKPKGPSKAEKLAAALADIEAKYGRK